MRIQKTSGKIDKIIVLFFLVAMMGYMPTARSSDKIVWIGAFLLLFLRTAWLSIQNKIKFSCDVNLGIYLLLVGYGFISCLWSKQTTNYMIYILVYFPIILLSVLCLCTQFQQRIKMDEFYHLIILAGLLAGIRYCVYTDWSGIATGYYMRGTFGGLLDNVTNYNNYTMPISIVCVLALYYAIVKNEKRYYLAVAMFFVMLLIGGSRKNLIAVPLVGVFFALSIGNATKKIKRFLIIIFIIAAAIYALMTMPVLSQIRDSMLGMFAGLFGWGTTATDVSTQERMFLIDEAKSVWANHFLIGVGWDNFREYHHLHVTAHNNYMEILASLGVIGFALFYMMFVRILYITINRSSIRRLAHEDIMLIGFALSYLFFEIGSVDLYNRERMILLLLMLYCHSMTTGLKTYRLTLSRRI